MIDWDRNDMPILGPAALRYQWDGRDGTLASWMSTLTTGGGAGASYVVANPATDKPGVTITSAAAASATAILSGPTLDLTKFRAVRFRAMVEMRPAGTSVGIFQFGLTQQPTPTRGVMFGKLRMDEAYQPTLLRVTAAGSSVLALTHFPYFQNGKRYDNLGLLVDCVSKDIYLMLGDTVIDMWEDVGAALELGPVTASIRVANNSATAEARSAIVRTFEVEAFV
ncbi:hypothetical protein [Microbacterium sp. NPDC089188]|uniref:hypothetical protein n=1 Tax=Microbacterium sp. NPDC089188 TaxID=3154971 RepID=UPI003416B8EA